MKLVALVKKNSGVDYHRINLPLDFYPLDPGDQVIRVSSDQELRRGVLEGVDIVFYSRESPFDFKTILELRKELGYKIVVDVDDYWYLYPTHYLTSIWIKNNTSQNIINSIREADLVICTHEKLKERIKSFNENVHVVPNSLPHGFDQFYHEPKDLLQPTLLYAGGITHYEDLKSISTGLAMCGSDPQINGKSKFLLAGYNSKTPKIWEKMAFLVSLYGSYETRESLPVNEYMSHYDHGSFAIAPLQNNDFNIYKSNLKIVEAGSKKLPIIASGIHPYTQDEVEGVILCKSNKDWYRAIKSFIKDHDKLEELGEKLHSYVVKNYSLLNHNEKRKLLFKSII